MSIGKAVPRVDGRDKVMGTLRFSADLKIDDLWHAATVRATCAGRIVSVQTDDAFDWSQVTLLLPQDIPGENVIQIIEADMPCLAQTQALYAGEPLALIAAPTRELAKQAVEHVHVTMEPSAILSGIDDIVARYKQNPDSLTVFSRYRISDGDLQAGFSQATQQTEGEYITGPQEHLYLETQAMLATPPDEHGVQRCLGSMQCPYYVRPAVAKVLGVDDERVIVEQAPTGGAFGGKEDYPSLLAAHVALLARASGHPVRLLLNREEDISVTTKRHSCYTRITSGANDQGELLALKVDVVMDAGAYVTLTPVVLSRGILHALGPYRCKNVEVNAIAVQSNIPPSGAFRGFGAPQTQFAMESHIDDIAHALNRSPIEIRQVNLLHSGDAMATGQILAESVAAQECLQDVLQHCQAEKRLAHIAKINTDPAGFTKRGLGFATVLHGAGFTGSGEKYLKSRAALNLQPDGTVEILAANTEMGQGVQTVFPQIVAEELALPVERVKYPLPDTSRVPNSGPTVASRSTMIVGSILQKAARSLLARLQALAGDGAKREGEHFRLPDGNLLRWNVAARQLCKNGEGKVEEQYEMPPGIEWNEETYKGSSYPVFAWGAVAVEVDVDVDTYEVRPLNLWLAYDIGRAVNPVAARGQLEGGSLQALGYGLCESMDIEDGRFRQNKLQTYIIPTTADIPEIHLNILEHPYSHGPGGAKGLGELPMNGVAAALRNAVKQALGVSVNTIPVTPERIFAAMQQGGGQ